MDDPTTVAELIPPRWRTWIYATSLAAQPALLAIGAATGAHEVVAVIQATLGAAGFGTAVAHRPTRQPSDRRR